MQVKKVKDWLKERSDEQFEPIGDTGEVVLRLKDNKRFIDKEHVLFKGFSYEIVGFAVDNIHVHLKSTHPKSVGPNSIEGIVEINQIEEEIMNFQDAITQ